MDVIVQLTMACFLVLVGVFLLIARFWVLPTGVIDTSIIVVLGEIFTFVGSLFGIDYHYKFKNKMNE